MAPGNANKNNVLPVWGNDKTMNLNNLILTNIQSSHYFKVNLFELKTYHEVIDEIYYKVSHMEPWEKGSRKTSGQTGMCGGVRGVGAGGIVSTAFCLLYKLFTLKLTRKQVNGLISHCDSPYIRALGFMYIRYTQPPADLWDWYEEYLDDEEELDVKAGTGGMMPIGEMLRHFLSKLEWYSTLFPRIPVPIQKDIEKKLNAHGPLLLPRMLANAGPRPGGPNVVGDCENGGGGTGDNGADGYRNSPAMTQTNDRSGGGGGNGSERHIPDEEVSWGEAGRVARLIRSDSRERQSRPKSSNADEERGGRDKTEHRREEGGDRGERLSYNKRGASERDYDADLNHEKRRQERRNGGGGSGRDYPERGENGGHREKDRRHRSRSKDRERRRSRSHSRDRHSGRRRQRRSRSRERHRY